LDASIIVLQTTETPNPSATPVSDALLQSAVAAPNISNGGEPIHFQVKLGSSAVIELKLYAITGEQIYEASIQGTDGLNTLVWQLRNKMNESVASGLYVYNVSVTDGAVQTSSQGDVLVLH
jgi:hypothetical protein